MLLVNKNKLEKFLAYFFIDFVMLLLYNQIISFVMLMNNNGGKNAR